MKHRRAVLGIDAAWTYVNPSGVALVCEQGDGWALRAVAGSYREFVSLAGVEPAEGGERGNLGLILEASAHITPNELCCVAVDMPIAKKPISKRRQSDDVVSQMFGHAGCSTHTPTHDRPGQISADLKSSFQSNGFQLRTSVPLCGKDLIEVYPHPALVVLSGADYRLPYKVGKIGKYWKDLPPHERKIQLLSEWSRILAVIKGEISAIDDHLVLPSVDAPMRNLKRFEDMLDATICAWVGICALNRRAEPFGDDNSAIWIPTSEARYGQ